MVQALRYCVLIHDAESKDIHWANERPPSCSSSVSKNSNRKASGTSVQEQRYRRSVDVAWLQDAARSVCALMLMDEMVGIPPKNVRPEDAAPSNFQRMQRV